MNLGHIRQLFASDSLAQPYANELLAGHLKAIIEYGLHCDQKLFHVVLLLIN